MKLDAQPEIATSYLGLQQITLRFRILVPRICAPVFAFNVREARSASFLPSCAYDPPHSIVTQTGPLYRRIVAD